MRLDVGEGRSMSTGNTAQFLIACDIFLLVIVLRFGCQ